MALLKLMPGVDYGLEEMADKWLYADREQFRRTDKSMELVHGILSPGQLELREHRDMITSSGNFTHVSPGCYHRVHAHWPYRPNSRRRYSPRQDYWQQDLVESQGHPFISTIGWTPSAVRYEVTSGYHYETISPRDPAWPVRARDGLYHHLDRYQRSRIRATMRKLQNMEARGIVTLVLAVRYGVPPWVITRCVVKGKR